MAVRRAPASSRSKRPVFSKAEVARLMYGFGDAPTPHPDTVELVTLLLHEYLQEYCTAVLAAAGGRKPKLPAFLHALRHDHKKLVRVHELLALDQELTSARATFRDIEEVAAPASGVKK